MNSCYLGDGLYAFDDGDHIVLETLRENGRHFVALDDEVLESFIRFLGRSRALKIAIERINAKEEK